MNLNSVFKRVILFGAIAVIIAFVFFVVKNINENQEKVDIGENKGTTSPVDTMPSEDNGKDVEPPAKDPSKEEGEKEDPEEKEQETPPQDENDEPIKEPEKEDRPQVAIIIDDLGYNPELDQELYQLDYPLTLAVLPFRSHTQETAETFAGKDNFELLLHLPLEPMDEVHKEEKMATVDMTEEEIVSFLVSALGEVEGVEGINNHKGSKFTSNETKMGYLLEEIRRRGLFFVDSYTLADSVGYSLSLEMGIPTTRRDVFLDSSNDKQDIIEKLQQLEEVARENGTAIGIGHHREKRGVDLVLVSEVLE